MLARAAVVSLRSRTSKAAPLLALWCMHDTRQTHTVFAPELHCICSWDHYNIRL